jgi:SUMO ligase MMS21 Smc5/6 complex component
METEELIIFDVHSAGNKFAQDCPICLQPIVYMASVCYCQCNINFHPKCVKQMLNGKQLTH